MKLVLFLVAFFLVSCGCEPEVVYCCKPEQSVLADSESENLCVDIKNNTIKTPAKLACENVTHILDDSELNYTITDDGRMILLMDELEKHIDTDLFCIANRTLTYHDRILVFCEEEEEEQIIDERILAYCMYVSVVFLTLTLIVYCALAEMRDLQGKSLINFCGSLAIGLCILGTLKLNLGYSNLGLCAARGFFTYFFLIASFFWMNAISVQILLSIRRPSRFDYGWKEFLWYALYAWGCPATITVSMVIVNSVPGYHRKPGIGLHTCWFFSPRHQWQYMYSVMTILILANICIFFYISTHLCRHSFASSHIKALKYKFIMTVRMFIIMGLPWVFEMISSLCRPHVFWVITDIFNTLQGIFIFLLLVVFRKRVIKAMFKRGWLDCISGFIERHLAVGDDDEEDVVHQTMDVGLQEEFTK
ncbi:probable G-protein coupled receptor Mth-like 2 [Maniola jurtina]|uniref:probable G-protein coupled receptor Mth-like 2 n=1 Tax=Maniola jurtina TaxID=191418 RepID=UPI001E686729|nr:probable G-protein coupled receptor Mth-like 2 [Maniola jurtina]